MNYRELMERVGQQGCQFSVASFTALAKQFGDAKQWGRVLTLLRGVLLLRGRVDTICYNVAITACGKGKQWQRALLLFSEVPEAKLEPDIVTYNAANLHDGILTPVRAWGANVGPVDSMMDMHFHLPNYGNAYGQ